MKSLLSASIPRLVVCVKFAAHHAFLKRPLLCLRLLLHMGNTATTLSLNSDLMRALFVRLE
jgi:hypothetical protein